MTGDGEPKRDKGKQVVGCDNKLHSIMTLLLSWLGVDHRRPASLYVASDSRFRWNNGAIYDYGKKVFCFKNSPDILGYCGDVIFPTIVLNQIVELGDKGLLFGTEENCDRKFLKIKEYLKKSLSNYPTASGVVDKSIKILYGTRDNNHKFHLYTLCWYLKTNLWTDNEIPFPDYSNTLSVLGSGDFEFIEKFKEYRKSDIQKTSRAIFQCFCDTLSEIKNVYCGGAPQLVGLYQKWNGINFGIISKNKRYFCGLEVLECDNLDFIEWRNEEFEVCSGVTMTKLPKSQRQPNPILLQRGNSLTVH